MILICTTDDATDYDITDVTDDATNDCTDVTDD